MYGPAITIRGEWPPTIVGPPSTTVLRGWPPTILGLQPYGAGVYTFD
jgi:hypothetical protein